MDITTELHEDTYVITGYGNGGFEINKTFYQNHITLHPDAGVTHLPVSTFRELEVGHVTEVLAHPPEPLILLIGTGVDTHKLPDSLFTDIKSQHVNVEVMNTGAACRTYNVLVSEGRQVAAVLFAV